MFICKSRFFYAGRLVSTMSDVNTDDKYTHKIFVDEDMLRESERFRLT